MEFVPDEEYFEPPELSAISWRVEPVLHDKGEKEIESGGDKVLATEVSSSEKPLRFKGRARLITGSDGKLMDDIDTDMIFHNKYLSITEIERMGEHTFETLQGYEGFASSTKPGDIVVAGGNFGCGSSRQQAVDCFISLGVSAIIIESAGAIYKRNVINSGFPFLEVPGLKEIDFREGEIVEVDFEKGTIKRENGEVIKAKPPSGVVKR